MTNENDFAEVLALSRDPCISFVVQFLRGAGFELPGEGIKAREWCLRKASESDPSAAYAAATLLAFGLFGETRRDEAVAYCHMAAESDFAPAILLLGSFHESGWGGLHPNRDVALELMKRAANKGYAPAMHTLALLFLHDESAAGQDEGRRYLLRAAELGDSNAQFTLANQLLTHGGSDQTELGVTYMKRAAEQENPHAHQMLGYFFQGGRHGLPRDASKAGYHFDRARELEELSWKSLSRSV